MEWRKNMANPEIMDMPKFKDGIVYFRNSGMNGLKGKYLLPLIIFYLCLEHSVIYENSIQFSVLCISNDVYRIFFEIYIQMNTSNIYICYILHMLFETQTIYLKVTSIIQLLPFWHGNSRLCLEM